MTATKSDLIRASLVMHRPQCSDNNRNQADDEIHADEHAYLYERFACRGPFASGDIALEALEAAK